MRKLLIVALVAVVALVSASGVYAKSTKAKAQTVKTQLPKTFVGIVSAVDTSAGTVTLTAHATKKGTVVATVSDTTKIVDSQDSVITLSDISAGDEVQVQGTYTLSTSTFSLVKRIRDLSLPVPTATPTPTDTPTPTPTP